jgi:hydroxymethylpyrimidine kinase/phosphomethylpyrimidine kinase
VLITPNIPETERITGIAIESQDDIREAAKILRELGAANVLIKGGHLINVTTESESAGPKKATDYLFIGDEKIEITGEYYETTATHGTGCILSAAIAANLALGHSLHEATELAKRFVNEGIRNAPMLGKGCSPIGIEPISRLEQRRAIDR